MTKKLEDMLNLPDNADIIDTSEEHQVVEQHE